MTIGRPAGSFKLTDAQIQRMFRAYDYGVSIEDICERFQIHAGTLNYYLRKHKHPVRQPQNHKKERRHAHNSSAHPLLQLPASRDELDSGVSGVGGNEGSML